LKFYLVSAPIPDFDNGEEKHHNVWASSRAEAAAGRKKLVESGATRKDLRTYEVEVPTSKTGLLEFLNDLGGNTVAFVAMRNLLAQ